MRKRFLMPGEYWNTGLLEQWLEEKAAQGWLPVSFLGYSSGKFEKAEPQTLRFRLEPDRPETYDVKCDRETAYQEMGWQFATILGDYRVYYSKDPADPELYTDPATQAWAWEKQLRKLRRNHIIAILLLMIWTVWQFRSIWEKGTPVQLLLYGMWAVWLFVILVFGSELIRYFRVLRGVRQVRHQLAVGIPLNHGGDLPRSLRQRRRREVLGWTMIALLGVFIIGLARSGRSVDLAEAPEPLPCVAMETLAPETAGLKMDWARYREHRTLLVPFRCEIEQWQWNSGPAMEANLDCLRFGVFAKPLYDERLTSYLKGASSPEVEPIDDPRFDEAVLVTRRNVNDSRRIQAFVARKGKTVLYQAVNLNTDLREHIDEFAAILADFQQRGTASHG